MSFQDFMCSCSILNFWGVRIYLILGIIYTIAGLPSWLSGKEYSCNAGDMSWIPGLRRSPGAMEGYSPWGCKRAGHNLVTKQQQIYTVAKGQCVYMGGMF